MRNKELPLELSSSEQMVIPIIRFNNLSQSTEHERNTSSETNVSVSLPTYVHRYDIRLYVYRNKPATESIDLIPGL